MRTFMLRSLCAALLSAALLMPASAFAWQPLDDCAPTWDDQPSPYHVNSSGYSEIDLTTVRRIFADSFDEWSRPCCSDWQAVEMGTTTGVAEDNRDSRNIFSFREASWPGELGDPRFTLAVTLTTWGIRGGRCSDLTADMTFNAANHTFATNDRSGVDLQAVTTHECGHWLGLAHTSVRTATMWPSYTSEEDRSLHSDDESGVCSLYPGDCGCDSTSDCDGDDVCEGGICVEPPCTRDSDCDAGLECDVGSGDCFVPPCRSDAECPGAQICEDGVCTIDADCPTCTPCETIADCGGGDWQCAVGSTGFCTRICDSGTDCPGNSACFDIEGQSFAICLNDDAGSAGVCHIDYVCTEEPSPCDGVTCGSGEVCNPATGECETVGGADGCIICDPCESPDECPGGDCFDFGGPTAVCSMECDTVADCPAGTDCVAFSGGGGTSNLCVNADVDSAGVCPGGFVCEDDEPADLCDGVRCPSGESCNPATGECVDDGSLDPDTGVPDVGGTDAGGPGGDCAICNECSSDSQCDGGSCLTVGAAGTYCTIDCSADSSVCPGNTECFDVTIGEEVRSLCLNSDAGASGICHSDFICIEVSSVEPDGGGVDGPDVGDSDTGTTPTPFAGVPTQRGCVSSANGGRLGALWAVGVMLLLGGTRRRRRE